WVRPQYYPKYGEGVMQAIWRESAQVRETAGICDVSTLGKIEIFGPDAGEFLNRLYINGWKSLPVGKARYGLMLREDGYVFDDGTTSRLAEDHYFMTTTTANAAGVLAHMEHYAQVVWPDLDVHFCSATEQWCGVAVAGPNARKVLQDAFGRDFDMSDENLPFMGVREFEWKGAKARIFRISFSGELTYEVNVAWRHGEGMWNTIWDAGQSHGLIPYGTEALSVLRIEKGHVAGNELDGRSTANDMGLGKMMSSLKEFVGKRMAARSGMVDPDRPKLVGVKLIGKSGRLRGGAHLIESLEDANTVANPDASKGWVTSVGDSPALGCWIGLAYLQGGEKRYGTRMIAHYPLRNENVEVEIVSPHFFDPEGTRLHG
ncbi:MAG: aminomethyltransferase family protein, partial [Pseudomonadota bacterium]